MRTEIIFDKNTFSVESGIYRTKDLNLAAMMLVKKCVMVDAVQEGPEITFLFEDIMKCSSVANAYYARQFVRDDEWKMKKQQLQTRLHQKFGGQYL